MKLGHMSHKCYTQKKFKGMDRYLVTPDEQVMVYCDPEAERNPYKVYAIINGRKKKVTEYEDFVSVTYAIQAYIRDCGMNTQTFAEYMKW